MTAWHLAEINIARFREPISDPVNSGFIAALDGVNALADASDGFVWRLAGGGNDALDIRAYDDPHIAVNMSVWRDLDALAAFTYRNPEHLAIMRRRKDWFERMELYMALWWVPAGHVPTVEEGKAKLDLLRQKGPHADVFTFRTPFPAPGSDGIAPILDTCA